MDENKTQYTYRFIPLILALFVLFIGAGVIFSNRTNLLVSSVAAADHTLNYTVDRSPLPQMNYYTLTYNIYVGTATTVTAKNSSDQTLLSVYDPTTDILTLTTDETSFSISLINFTGSTANVGKVQIAPLKENKLWAWSHGFDDNVQLLKATHQFQQFSMPATLYLNDYDLSIKLGQNIPHPPTKPNPPNSPLAEECDADTYECYLLVNPKIRQLFESGWAIGNHTENHTCWSPPFNLPQPTDEELWAEITDLDAKFQTKIIEPSSRSDYLINSFASPCFENYNDLIQSKIAMNETNLIMSEGGERDYASPDGFSGSANELPLHLGYDLTAPIIRDTRIEGMMNNDTDDANSLAFIQGMFDWLHDNATTNGPVTYWYNSISHGRNEAVFATALPYLLNTYGSNSVFDEVWLATAEEIYAYTYARENAIINLDCSTTIGDCSTSPIILPEIVTGNRQIYGRIFNDLNQNGMDDDEPGIPNVQINYWTDNACSGGTAFGYRTISDANGNYIFDGLDPLSCYQLQINSSTTNGFELTSLNTDSAKHGNKFVNVGTAENPDYYTKSKFSLPSSLIKAGFIQNEQIPKPTLPPSANQINGRIFNDLNKNGIDDNEPGIAGVTLRHWIDPNCNEQGNTHGRDTISASDGSYEITELNTAQCHFIQILEPSINGLNLTILNAGNNDNIDSDFHSNFYTSQIILPSANINGGLYEPNFPINTIHLPLVIH